MSFFFVFAFTSAVDGWLGDESMESGEVIRFTYRVLDAGPLSSRVPVQLSYASCRQSHIYAGNGLGNRKLPDRDLARPSASCIRG
jgi:hypothetical protein